jgi:hypothetical protein
MNQSHYQAFSDSPSNSPLYHYPSFNTTLRNRQPNDVEHLRKKIQISKYFCITFGVMIAVCILAHIIVSCTRPGKDPSDDLRDDTTEKEIKTESNQRQVCKTKATKSIYSTEKSSTVPSKISNQCKATPVRLQKDVYSKGTNRQERRPTMCECTIFATDVILMESIVASQQSISVEDDECVVVVKMENESSNCTNNSETVNDEV